MDFPLSHRPDQLAAALEREIRVTVSKGLHDPRIAGLITITGVKVSPDLRSATVGVSVLPAEKAKLTLQGIISAAPHIRREVGERVRTRVMPELHFKLDSAAVKEAGIIRALQNARDSEAASEALPGWRSKDTPHHAGIEPPQHTASDTDQSVGP